MIYLLHFQQRYHHAAHYMGYTEDLERRLQEHRSGIGSRLLAVIARAGIAWELAQTWPGDRRTERRFKMQKNSPRLCPICRQLKQAQRRKAGQR